MGRVFEFSPKPALEGHTQRKRWVWKDLVEVFHETPASQGVGLHYVQHPPCCRENPAIYYFHTQGIIPKGCGVVWFGVVQCAILCVLRYADPA